MSMSNDNDTFARLCAVSGKMGGISYDAARAKIMCNDLREWIGKGTSRKTYAMRSLIDQIEKRLDTILTDVKV
jgi:hypothetical protein